MVLSAFQRKLVAAGLPKVRLHDLRHSCSSLLQAKGISPRVVQQRLGHADLSMTLRYTKVLPELAEAAARRMEDILASADEVEGVDDQDQAVDQRCEGSGGCQDGCQTEPDDGHAPMARRDLRSNRMVRPEGIEPPALRSGAARSVR